MTGVRLRELKTFRTKLDAALEVRDWGFPRQIELVECERGAWFRMGPSVVFWFEHPHPDRPHDLPLHVAIEPKVRHKWAGRRWLHVMQACAELLEAERICVTPVPAVPEIGLWCARLGWAFDGTRYTLELGD